MKKIFTGNMFSGCSQVIVVACGSMNTIYATLTTYQKCCSKWAKRSRMGARVGKCGLVYDSDRIEGDMRTPIGIYSIPWAFGTARNPGTKLPYKIIDNNTYYDGQYDSPTYNTLIEGKPNNNEYESMNIEPYRYGALINFNAAGQPGKGNGIFLHCSTPSGYTAGCVSVSTQNMVRILRWLDPEQNPRIAICTSYQFSRSPLSQM
jgi:L,D-peptidoglycan transpeptidase YkuD (ErfK/YbiS/YcfS/YnhG family)